MSSISTKSHHPLLSSNHHHPPSHPTKSHPTNPTTKNAPPRLKPPPKPGNDHHHRKIHTHRYNHNPRPNHNHNHNHSSNATKPNPSRSLYFAYGSNLSAVQMRMRCTHNPALSGNPVAIGRLEGWKWIICETGYANVLPPRELRVGEQVKATTVEDGCEVWGVLYEMAPEDEFLLDGYEFVDHSSGLASVDLGGVRPREQGEGHYNKWYLPATITMWLDGAQEKARGGGGKEVVLVYVDEERVRMGPPKEEYVGRMNRAIREAEKLGVDRVWVGDVMRRFIPDV